MDIITKIQAMQFALIKMRYGKTVAEQSTYGTEVKDGKLTTIVKDNGIVYTKINGYSATGTFFSQKIKGL